MGSAASKARKLPTAPSQALKAAKAPPAWAGARTGDAAQIPRATVSRTADIEADGGDPQLLARLRTLGPVAINSHATAGTNARITHMLQQQAESEEDAQRTRPGRNKLHSHNLASLLDELREVGHNPARANEVAALAERYDIDMSQLQQLRAVLNTPSIGATVNYEVDGDVRTKMMAVWTDESYLAAETPVPVPIQPPSPPQQTSTPPP